MSPPRSLKESNLVFPILFFSATALLVSSAQAQHEGHDMDDWGLIPEPDHASMGHAVPGQGPIMTPYLHLSLGDALWFKEWIPRSKGAMFGACLGLFFLGIVERWIAALRAVANVWWRIRASEMLDYLHDNKQEEQRKSPASAPATSLRKFPTRFSPPFIALNEICRGLLYVAQSTLMFAFMLVVMTYQASFLISIVLGLGIGETLFGRFTHADVGLYL
ncbi:hypothetical protein FA15DRAFT_704816 [Coprinopsis marcescibilis]|uniref:Copper transport protein n=1 Tax=Coprinopsis marcescibilis TaxID=230819 RepID=A0A5C3KV10_COPMA|nr:hypothetical protein FA15DRAFT_704816 [Coprinopsis marcescibilis]